MLFWWDKAAGPTRPFGQVATSWVEPSVGLTTGTRTRVVSLGLPSLCKERAIRNKGGYQSELEAESESTKGEGGEVVYTGPLHFTEDMAYTFFAAQG